MVTAMILAQLLARPACDVRPRLVPEIDFRVPTGDDQTRKVTVRNRGDGWCVLDDVVVDPFDGRIVVLAPAMLGPRQRSIVYVTFIAEPGAARRYAVDLVWSELR